MPGVDPCRQVVAAIEDAAAEPEGVRAGAQVAPVPQGGDRGAQQLGGFADGEQLGRGRGGVVAAGDLVGPGGLRGLGGHGWVVSCRRREFVAVGDSPPPTSSVDLRFSSCTSRALPGAGRGSAWGHRRGARPAPGDGVREAGCDGDPPEVGGACSGPSVLLPFSCSARSPGRPRSRWRPARPTAPDLGRPPVPAVPRGARSRAARLPPGSRPART